MFTLIANNVSGFENYIEIQEGVQTRLKKLKEGCEDISQVEATMEDEVEMFEKLILLKSKWESSLIQYYYPNLIDADIHDTFISCEYDINKWYEKLAPAYEKMNE